jgi:hypothetical protein
MSASRQTVPRRRNTLPKLHCFFTPAERILSLLSHLLLIPTRWMVDTGKEGQEDIILSYGIAGLGSGRVGDIRRGVDGAWELWLSDARGIMRAAGVFTSPGAALASVMDTRLGFSWSLPDIRVAAPADR